jgi:hypothetical protein
MKVDEKMIEAVARELARMDCDPLLQSEISIGLAILYKRGELSASHTVKGGSE